jgi:hypothetical protein
MNTAGMRQCWYMVIETMINGEVFHQEAIPDEELMDIPGATWKQNTEARQQIVDQFVRRHIDKMERFFNKDFQISYRLVVRSKMTSNGE